MPTSDSGPSRDRESEPHGASLTERVAAQLRQAGERTGVDFLASPLVAAVSGGPDSLALLDSLAHLYPADRLIVAHLDHGLRPGSAAEANLVAEAAAARGLRIHQRREDVAALAEAERLTLEEAGRLARYRFLTEVARAEGAPAVAVGHNADDQVETILLHLLRGSGLAGLRGMQVVGRLPEAADLWLLRPLLGVSRAEILAYCADHGLRPVHDASNLDTTFLRNRVRHDLLPLLESYNPQIRERLRGMAAVLAADYEVVERAAADAWQNVRRADGEGWVELDLAGWRGQPLGLRRALLRRALAHGASGLSDVGFQTVEAALAVADSGSTGAEASLPGDVRLVVGYDTLLVHRPGSAPPLPFPQLPSHAPLFLPVPGTVTLDDGWQLTAELVDADPAAAAANTDPWRATISLDGIGALQVRPRQPGERFQPLGLNGHYAHVKEVMIDRKIPAAARGRWPLVAGDGHLLWLTGHQIDERVKVTAGSRRVARLTCSRPG